MDMHLGRVARGQASLVYKLLAISQPIRFKIDIAVKFNCIVEEAQIVD